MAIVKTSANMLRGIKSDRKSDSLGTTADGTNSGITLDTVNYKLGSGAYSFDGTDDYIELSGTVSDWAFLSNGTSAWTITYWFKDDNTAQNSRFFSTMNDASGTNRGISITHDGTAWGLAVYDGTASAGYPFATNHSGAFSDTGTWHHYAIVYDNGGASTGTAKLYKDGSLLTTFTQGRAFSSSDPNHAPLIGKRADNARYLSGDLDDFSVWSRELTATEIGKLVNNNDPPIVEFGTADDSTMTVYDGRRAGQRVTDTSLRNISITSVKARLFRYNTTNGSATLVCRIRKLSDDSVVATSSTVAMSNLTGNGGNISDATDQTFTFSGVTTPNEDYQILIEGSTTSNITSSNPCYVVKQTSVTSNKGYESYYNSSYAYDTNKEATFDVTYPSTAGDAQLVSSINNKSKLKAYYSMDSTNLDITPTVSDDFSSDLGWNSNTSDWEYDATNDRLDLDPVRRSTTAQRLYIDLQDADYLNGSNLSDTAWVARWKINSGNQNSSGNVQLHMAFSNNINDSGSTQQSASVVLNMSPTETTTGFQLMVTTGNFENSTSPTRISSSAYSQNDGLSTNTVYYIELIRDGDDWTLTVYSDSGYSSSLGTTTITKSGLSGLQYMKIINDSEQSTTKTKTGAWLDDLKIYDGVSTLSGSKNDHSTTSDLEALVGVPTNSVFLQTDDTPSYWWYNGTSWLLDGSVTFTEDFSEATPTTWTEDSSAGYENNLEPYKSTTNGLWFDMDYNTVTTSGTLDLSNTNLIGSNLNNTKWTMRFKINFTVSTGSGTVWIGFSDNQSVSNVAQRFAGVRAKASTGFTNGSDNSGQALTTSNRTDGGTYSISTGTDYYVTCSRTDANTLKTTISTNSDYSGGTTLTATTLETATDDLKYFKIMNHTVSGTGQIKGYLYDLQIQNGISEWLE